ncbi:MAG: pteridine reductase [Legionella sp.]|nr:MAG: pteridine reductase [Legionella sp.]
MGISSPVALVTGAAKRIGAAIATRLHQSGFTVMIHYHHSEEAAIHLAEQFNDERANSACTVRADLRDHSTVQNIIHATVSRFGQLNVLVNNASIFSRDDADWLDMFACNVQAPYGLSRAAFSHLSQTTGSIINITDIHANMPLRDYAVYCQSKAALAMQTRALALEFAPKVRVNAIAPGAIAWPEGDNHLSTEIQAHILAKTLLQRHGDPHYIAQAVMYLVSNDFVTGQTLQVDGGRYLNGI